MMTNINNDRGGFHEGVEAAGDQPVAPVESQEPEVPYLAIYRQREGWIEVEGRRRFGGPSDGDQRRRLEMDAEERFPIPPICEISCPLCGGAMHDRREVTRETDRPGYHCRTWRCRGRIWLPAAVGASAA